MYICIIFLMYLWAEIALMNYSISLPILLTVYKFKTYATRFTAYIY